MARAINGILQNMISKGYTLWLMPKDEVYTRFAQLIKKLEKEYAGPVFEPHVTLLGDIELPEEEMIKRTDQLVKDQKSFPVALGQIGYENFFFRALFARAEITQPLLSLHEKAKNIFDMQQIPSYIPHLSLLYGDYLPELKEKIIAEIGKEQLAEWTVNSVHLIKGGQVRDWKIIKEFTFS